LVGVEELTSSGSNRAGGMAAVAARMARQSPVVPRTGDEGVSEQEMALKAIEVLSSLAGKPVPPEGSRY
jgi:hypothetical protein